MSQESGFSFHLSPNTSLSKASQNSYASRLILSLLHTFWHRSASSVRELSPNTLGIHCVQWINFSQLHVNSTSSPWENWENSHSSNFLCFVVWVRKPGWERHSLGSSDLWLLQPEDCWLPSMKLLSFWTCCCSIFRRLTMSPYFFISYILFTFIILVFRSYFVLLIIHFLL